MTIATNLGFPRTFAMARGLPSEDVDVPAMEMTEWFDTNCHSIIPELFAGMSFARVDILRALGRAGAEWVQLDEPCLVTDLAAPPLDAVCQSLPKVAGVIDGRDVLARAERAKAQGWPEVERALANMVEGARRARKESVRS